MVANRSLRLPAAGLPVWFWRGFRPHVQASRLGPDSCGPYEGHIPGIHVHSQIVFITSVD